MAGQQLTNKQEKCPEGYYRVFGPLCIEYDTLQKIEETLPDIPEFDFSNPGCEAVLSAYKSVMNSVEQAIETPKQLIQVAKGLVERPFTEAQKILSSALGVFDEINNAIDNLLQNDLVDEFIRAVDKMLACPFIADMPIAKTAAALLDAIENGSDITSYVGAFKDHLAALAGSHLDALKKTPMDALANLDKLYDDALQRSGIEDLIQKANDLYQCIEAACNLIDVAERIPKTPGAILDSINAKIDETTGRISGAVVRAANNTQASAYNAAKKLAVVKFAKP